VVIIAVTMMMMRPSFRSCCTSAKDCRCSYNVLEQGSLILGKKSLRRLIKPAGKAEPIKVRLKLPKKLNLALPSLIFRSQNGQNAANIGGKRRSVPRDWFM
jgi:hypothetical protein